MTYSFNPIKKWDHFFFEEKSTDGLALFRIIWTLLLGIYFLMDLGNVNDFYGPHGVISMFTVREEFTFSHLNIFNFFRPSYDVAYGILLAYGISLLFSFLGLFTRYSLILAFVLMTSLHQRNIWLLSSSELLMRTITLYLIFSPCGNSLSLDSILGRFFPEFKKPKVAPIWSLRLIQIQVSVIYLFTVWQKLQGRAWIDGSAVYYATRIDGLTNLSLPFIMDSEVFLRLMTWGTLLVEASLAILIWSKRFRRPVILVGLTFHLLIHFVMSIPFFEFFMMALLVNFYSPEELHSFVRNIQLSVVRIIQESTLQDNLKEKLTRVAGGAR